LRISSLETAIDCLIESPVWQLEDSIGFNGQAQRKKIFQEIIQSLDINEILETGTWVGSTTGYLALTSKLPVYTCESNPRFYALSKMRLAKIEGIEFFLGDSRAFLRNRAKTPSIEHFVFIYLDAHWYEDCPLKEELEIIASNWKSFVIMVDDFQVPSDPGYLYDNYAKDYGRGVALNLKLIQPVIKKHRLSAFFPAASSMEETGAKRGCVILSKSDQTSKCLSELPSLRMFDSM